MSSSAAMALARASIRTRPGFAGSQVRYASTSFFRRAGQQAQFRSAFRQQGAKRFESGTAAPPQQSLFKRLLDSPVGFKTVHFWAPVMKWAIVIAGIADFARPAEKLSITQNLALTATGIIWTRWCLIIKPKNYLLAAVNFFLGIVGIVQVGRILLYRQSLKDTPVAAPVVAEEETLKH